MGQPAATNHSECSKEVPQVMECQAGYNGWEHLSGVENLGQIYFRQSVCLAVLEGWKPLFNLISEVFYTGFVVGFLYVNVISLGDLILYTSSFQEIFDLILPRDLRFVAVEMYESTI